MKKQLAISLVVMMLSGAAFAATDSHVSHAGMNKGAEPISPATKAYVDSMMSMHDTMMEGIKDKNPDVAFAKGMLSHHVGAIEMAKIELQYGKDPEMRKLAEDIIKAQDAEIKQMQRWIEANESKK